MHKHLLTATVALIALTACTPDKIASTLASATGRLAGTVYLPATQVAIVASGAGNIVASGAGNLVGNSGGTYVLLARSDEKGIDGAKVVVTGADGKTYTAYTLGGGKYAIDCPQNMSYQGSATVTAKDKTITLTAYGTNTVGSSMDFTVAMNAVASKIAQGGVSLAKVDGAKVAALAATMESDLQTTAETPTPVTQADAAGVFDSKASDGLKTQVQALISASK